MLISVVIPHLNQPEFLAKCLSSLAQGARVPDEIFVVDNGSKHMPEDVCAAYPGVTLLREDEPGPGLARNRGVADARGDILAFIDADCLADPAWLATAETLMQDPNKEILGGDVRIHREDPNRPTLIECYESVYAYRMDRYIKEQGFTGTGNLVVRRAILEDVGPFGGIAVAEDRDWGHRARAKGYKIDYAAGMKVYHPARPSLADLYVKWDRQLSHDYHGRVTSVMGAGKWLLKAIAMLPSVLWEVPRIATSDRISGMRERLLAFAGLIAIRSYRARRMLSLLVRGGNAEGATSWNRS